MASGPRWRRWLMRLAPWVVTGVVTALLLRRYDVESMALEIARGDALSLVPWALLAGAVSLASVATADWIVMATLFGRLGWRDVLRGKGGTGVLAAVSYGVGHSGYGLWVARANRCSARSAVGTIAYVMLSDLTAVCLIASVTIWMTDLRLPEGAELLLRVLAPAGAVALIAAALLGPRFLPRLVSDPKLVRPWMEIPARVYLASLAVRTSNALVSIFITWGAAQTFGVDVPLHAFLTYLPVVFLIGSLPINVAGLGAVQVAWLLFFEPYAPAERIIVFQFLLTIFVHAALVLRGLPFVGGAMADIDRGAKAAAGDDG